MPYYIELTRRIADEPKFRFLGLSAIHKSLTIIELAGQTNEPHLMAKFRTIPVPLRGFRSDDEDAAPAIFVSDGRDLPTMPTMPGDRRPYAAGGVVDADDSLDPGRGLGDDVEDVGLDLVAGHHQPHAGAFKSRIQRPQEAAPFLGRRGGAPRAVVDGRRHALG